MKDGKIQAQLWALDWFQFKWSGHEGVRKPWRGVWGASPTSMLSSCRTMWGGECNSSMWSRIIMSGAKLLCDTDKLGQRLPSVTCHFSLYTLCCNEIESLIITKKSSVLSHLCATAQAFCVWNILITVPTGEILWLLQWSSSFMKLSGSPSSILYPPMIF